MGLDLSKARIHICGPRIKIELAIQIISPSDLLARWVLTTPANLVTDWLEVPILKYVCVLEDQGQGDRGTGGED